MSLLDIILNFFRRKPSNPPTPKVVSMGLRSTVARATTNDSTTSLTVTLPDKQQGDTLLLGFTSLNTVTIPTPSGWTAKPTSTGASGVKVSTFTKQAGTESNTYTFTFPAGTTALTLSAWEGTDQTTPIQSTAVKNGVGSSTTLTPTAVSGVGPDDIVVYVTGIRPDLAGTPTLNMPNTNGWTAPAAGAAAGSNQFHFASSIGLAYKQGATDTPVVTTSAACEFGHVSFVLNGAGVADTTPPSVPTGLVVGAVTSTTVPLSWAASTDDVGVASYLVYRNGVQVGNPVGTSFTDSGLSASTTYSYTVAARDAAGNTSAVSAPVSATTSAPPADTTPPSTPTGVTVGTVTTSTVAISWNSSTDNVGVTGYQVYRNNVQVGTPAGTSFTDSGLSANTTYNYNIKAYDAAGNVSAASTTVNATTASSGGGTTVPGKSVVFSAAFSDASQWTVGRTSSYPGSSPQTNPNDHKWDRISPSISAPDADGTFRAVRNGSYWDADLVTTEYATGNFQAQVGDSLTATVTLNNQTGAWPAIWTWSTGALQNLPGHGEVDLFEYHGENADTLELTNHVTSGSFYAHVVQPGVPFELRVDFDAAGVKFYANGTLLYTAGGLPSNWKSNLIVNMSVASVDNPYHPEPPAGVNEVNFKVQNLKVWR